MSGNDSILLVKPRLAVPIHVKIRRPDAAAVTPECRANRLAARSGVGGRNVQSGILGPVMAVA